MQHKKIHYHLENENRVILRLRPESKTALQIESFL